MKFIHTGDLHLDSPFRGLQEMPTELWQKIHDSTFAAFERIVDDALKLRVDFVLIAGDIYDREKHSIAAAEFFEKQCQRLDKAKIPVLILYGNHDCQLVDQDNALPANVYVFPNHVTTKILKVSEYEQVAVTGFSYDQRWIDTDQLNKYPPRRNVTWQIGMLHGAQKQDQQHDHYAPFTIDELQQKGYDYWALGHIHKPGIIAKSPVIAYCGTPQARNKNEAGPHGYYLVEGRDNKLVPTFKPVDTIRWQQLSVDLSQAQTVAEVERTISVAVEKQHFTSHFYLISVSVDASDHLPNSVRHLLANGDLLANLQQRFLPGSQWWIYEIGLIEQQRLPRMTDLDQRYWQEVATAIFTSSNFLNLTSSLTKEDFLAKRLADLDPEQLKKQVIALLGQEEKPDDH